MKYPISHDNDVRADCRRHYRMHGNFEIPTLLNLHDIHIWNDEKEKMKEEIVRDGRVKCFERLKNKRKKLPFGVGLFGKFDKKNYQTCQYFYDRYYCTNSRNVR